MYQKIQNREKRRDGDSKVLEIHGYHPISRPPW
jgi:hypothetical protein